MADIDFVTDVTDGFSITLSDNPRKVTGNRALLNRFELTFLTKKRVFSNSDGVFQDPYGGDAGRFMDRPRVLSNTQAIASALTIAIQQTIDSLQSDEPPGLPETERLDGAELVSLDIINDIITAKIEVRPVSVESYDILVFNLPITRSN